jgi:hypothetical protein
MAPSIQYIRCNRFRGSETRLRDHAPARSSCRTKRLNTSDCKREREKETGSVPNPTENLAKRHVTVPFPSFSRPMTNTVGPSGRGTGTKAANPAFSDGYARSAALEPAPFPDSVYTLSQHEAQESGCPRCSHLDPSRGPFLPSWSFELGSLYLEALRGKRSALLTHPAMKRPAGGSENGGRI